MSRAFRSAIPFAIGRSDGAADGELLPRRTASGCPIAASIARLAPVTEEGGQLVHVDQAVVDLPEQGHGVDRLDPVDASSRKPRPDLAGELGDAIHPGRGQVVPGRRRRRRRSCRHRRRPRPSAVVDDGRVVVGEERLDRLLVADPLVGEDRGPPGAGQRPRSVTRRYRSKKFITAVEVLGLAIGRAGRSGADLLTPVAFSPAVLGEPAHHCRVRRRPNSAARPADLAAAKIVKMRIRR